MGRAQGAIMHWAGRSDPGCSVDDQVRSNVRAVGHHFKKKPRALGTRLLRNDEDVAAYFFADFSRISAPFARSLSYA